MTTFFEQLGRQIQAAWLRHDAREAEFPLVCMEALTAQPPNMHVGIDDVISLAFATDRLVHQIDVDSDFGQPPITVFADSRFYISVLFWLDGTTAIHEHSFSGAFHVLHGGSILTSFAFEEQRAINEHMKVGRLRETDVELLAPGATREIRSGGGTIHSLFHLGRPSATVVVRTHADAIWRPQRTYWRPGIACNPKYDRGELKRRRDMITLVNDTAPQRLNALIAPWLDKTDYVSAFLCLVHAVSLVPPEQGDALLATTRTRHEGLANLVGEVIENDRRESFIIRRRLATRDDTLRFFLALLLNVRGRQRALDVVEKRFPGRDPVESIAGWIRALGQAPGLEAGDDSALGFGVDDVVVDVLRGLFRGLSDADVIAEFSRSRTTYEADRAALGDLCTALKQSEAFRYVLAPV